MILCMFNNLVKEPMTSFRFSLVVLSMKINFKAVILITCAIKT